MPCLNCTRTGSQSPEKRWFQDLHCTDRRVDCGYRSCLLQVLNCHHGHDGHVVGDDLPAAQCVALCVLHGALCAVLDALLFVRAKIVIDRERSSSQVIDPFR